MDELVDETRAAYRGARSEATKEFFGSAFLWFWLGGLAFMPVVIAQAVQQGAGSLLFWGAVCGACAIFSVVVIRVCLDSALRGATYRLDGVELGLRRRLEARIRRRLVRAAVLSVVLPAVVLLALHLSKTSPWARSSGEAWWQWLVRHLSAR